MKTTAPNSENLEVRSEKRDQDSSFSLPSSHFSLQPPALVPKLRFPEFRGAETWHVTSLDSICEILNNRRRPITGNERTPGPYPYYGASGIVDYVGDFIFEERLLLVGEDGAKWGAFEKTAFIADGKYWVNNHAHVLKPIAVNDTVLENYLTMLDLSSFVTGAAPPKLTLGKLKGIPVTLPPKPAEQQKIAECLSSVDELIAAQARNVDALKTHKKGLMQQLFPREGETQPRLRFPEFHHAGEWEKKTLGQLIEIASGQVDPRQPPYCESPQIGSENIESHSGKLVNVRPAGDKGVT
jgi:type I restriction enzyme S subunit